MNRAEILTELAAGPTLERRAVLHHELWRLSQEEAVDLEEKVEEPADHNDDPEVQPLLREEPAPKHQQHRRRRQ